MRLHKKTIGIIVSALIAITNIAVFAQTESKPQTAFSVEPKRTESGIDYNLYIENPNFLSTLFFEMSFDGKNPGKATLENNECFDVLHTEWNADNNISVKGYLGRTGYKTGFSSNEKIKVAKITIPLSVSSTGEFTANVSKAICAGITETDGNAVKGNVMISETSIKYVAKECSILEFGKAEAYVFSTENRNADVIFAAYDQNGKLISTHKENVALNQGTNTVSVSGIDFDKSVSVSVMIWDSTATMRPLADKEIFNNKNGD